MIPELPHDAQQSHAAHRCQPPANHLPTAGNKHQQTIDWSRQSLTATARRWGITGIALRIITLADDQTRQDAITKRLVEEGKATIVDGVAAVRILSSQRKLARLLGCSGTMIDKAIIKLESLGLASRGTDRQGTLLMLWVGRLFDAPVTTRPELRPPEPGCQPGANPRSLSLRDNNPFFALSESVSFSNQRAEFWSRDGLPWERLTDDDLLAATRGGDTAILRELYREAVKLNWLRRDDAEQFLAICWHAATAIVSKNYRGRIVDNPRVGLLRHRLKGKKFRNLSEESYERARQTMNAMQPRSQTITNLALNAIHAVD